MSLRLPFALLLALLITLSIFGFMQQLIQSKSQMPEVLDEVSMVELFQTPPKEPESEPEPQPETIEPAEIAEPEPTLEPLSAELPALAPSAPVEQLMPTVDLGSLAIDTGSSGDAWSMPLAGNAAKQLLEEIGEDDQGFIEVVPYGTRQPNVPELAWTNKLNGWVLIAFNVTPKGETANIRVLDANPRGIFEADVIKAVKGWRYEVRGNKTGQNLLLTQKIELFWKDYPMNIKEF